MATTGFIFYANIDSDTLYERVRFWVEGTILKKGVIKPTGVPLDYDLQNEDVTLTVTAAGNSEVVAGVFTAPLSQFGGQSLFAFASGFLTTDDEPVDVTGNEFGIFVL